jgi:hypothetical protein
MKFTLLTTLSAAAAALAASVTPAHFNTIDAATYKAIANGTLSPADLPPVGVIFVLVETQSAATDKISCSAAPISRRAMQEMCNPNVEYHTSEQLKNLSDISARRPTGRNTASTSPTPAPASV